MNNHDNLIIQILINKKNNLISSNKQRKIKEKYPNILSYLLNRFTDSSSLNETIRRIQYNIIEHPKCPICGKYVKYGGYKLGKIVFANTCSPSCGSKLSSNKVKQTKLERYGDPNYNNFVKGKQTKLERYGDSHYNNKDKIKETCLKKYGLANGGGSKLALEKIKNTNLKRYGYEMPLQSKEIRNKIKETNIKKYGVEYVLLNKKIQKKRQNTCLLKYGGISPMESKEIASKSYNVRIKNHTWSSSSIEEKIYIKIKKIFPLVKRQYKEERYPWHCDFYIPELDYFIEINGYWVHGEHPYNPNSIEDQKIIEKWKQKYNNGEHPLYERAIYGWTISDVEKRETAKRNNLNYKEVWTLEEGKEFIYKLAVEYDKMS